MFYRSIQVARDRFGAAICVGTSAVYRRTALEPQGGPTLIPYAEDVHTGLDVRRAGWSMVYVPVVLSTGICPDNLDAFVRQQYRWCTGNAGVVFSRRLWSVRMPVAARLTYISGFFYYAYTSLLTFFGPIIPIVMLAFLPGQIRLRNFVILGPAMVAGFVLYPLWHRSRYGPSVWPLGLARGWAHVFSIWDSARGKTMGWHPTRTPGSTLRRFRVCVCGWSGGTALLWVVLALWRTVTLGSAQFAILVFFGVLNLALVGRVIFREAANRMRSRLVTLLAVLIAAAGLTLTAVRLVAHASTPAVAHASLSGYGTPGVRRRQGCDAASAGCNAASAGCDAASAGCGIVMNVALCTKECAECHIHTCRTVT